MTLKSKAEGYDQVVPEAIFVSNQHSIHGDYEMVIDRNHLLPEMRLICLVS